MLKKLLKKFNLPKAGFLAFLLSFSGLAFAGGGGGGGIVGAIVGVVAVIAAPFTFGTSLALAGALLAGAAVGYMLGTTLEMMVHPPSFDMPDMSNAAAASQNSGITVNKQGTNIPIPVIYGQRRVGGARVFVSTNGTENRDLYMALVLAEGEIDSIVRVIIDDITVWTGTSTHGSSYTPNTSAFQPYFTFETYHGRPDQTASPLLKNASGWDDTKKLSGIAYLAVKCSWPNITTNDDAKKNPWGGIPNIVVEMRGKRVQFPSNFTYDYVNVDYNSRLNWDKNRYLGQTGYSNNPVDCLLDYLRNPVYGKGLADTQIDWYSFYKERIRWTKDQNGNVLADNLIHKTNGIIFTDRTVMENVKTILLNMRSSLIYQDGRYRLVVVDNGDSSSIYAAASTSVMTITTEDIIDGIKIQAESADGKANRMTISYMGYIGSESGTDVKTYEALDYVYPPIGSPTETTYQAQDGGRLVETKMTFEHITDATTAAKLAQIVLERARNKGKIITFQGTSRMYQLEVGDVITLQYPSLSINDQYRVKSVVQNEDFTFVITLEEQNDVTYAYNPTPQVNTKYKQWFMGDPTKVPGGGPVLPGPVNPVPTPTPVASAIRIYSARSNNYAVDPYYENTTATGPNVRLSWAVKVPNALMTNISSCDLYWRVSGTSTWTWSGNTYFDNNSPSGYTADAGVNDMKPGTSYDFRYDFKDITMSRWGTSVAFSWTTTYKTPTATSPGVQS